jgi:NosR/NirI family nitrous oxide reductase transcriptional regulator
VAACHLLFILVCLGWRTRKIVGGHVLTFATPLRLTGLQLGIFWQGLLIFLLWVDRCVGFLPLGAGHSAAGRPFALQELLNNIAQAVKIPQYRLPWGLNDGLWPIKYIIFCSAWHKSLYSISLW